MDFTLAEVELKVRYANETGIEFNGSPGEIRELSGRLPSAPVYTAYSTTVQVVTAPPATITAFFDGSGPNATIRSYSISTAATSIAPTGTSLIRFQNF
ncbi:hypothetical protein ABW19_dt0204369 [Dactylella cylindrospora]|nr:hypothetical protein ABW19_dt0204369 [Dactylella cylindrospora]